MNRYLKGLVALSVCLALVGCDKKSAVTTEKTVKGPGGTTTVTTEQTIKESGANPPPANTAQPVSPNDGK
jgi:predicted component of type VI protein secretion system